MGTPIGTIAVNVTWMKEDSMLVKRIAANTLQSFTSYSEILVGNCNFSYPLHLTPPLGVFPLEFRKKIWSSENYQAVKIRGGKKLEIWFFNGFNVFFGFLGLGLDFRKPKIS